jgi:hypothetical protein
MFAAIKATFVAFVVLFVAFVTIYPAYLAAGAFYMQTHGWGGSLAAFVVGFLVWCFGAGFVMKVLGVLE